MSVKDEKLWLNVLLVGALLFSVCSAASFAGQYTYEDGVRTYQDGHYETALAIFNEVAHTWPGDENVMYFQAICHAQLGHIDVARKLYYQVIDLSPQSQAADRSRQGLAYLPQEKPQVAETRTHTYQQDPSDFFVIRPRPEPVGPSQKAEASEKVYSAYRSQYQSIDNQMNGNTHMRRFRSEEIRRMASEQASGNTTENADVQPSNLNASEANALDTPTNEQPVSYQAQSAKSPAEHPANSRIVSSYHPPQSQSPQLSQQDVYAYQMMMGGMGGMNPFTGSAMGVNYNNPNEMMNNPLMMQMLQNSGVNAGQAAGQMQMDPKLFSTMMMNQMMGGMDSLGTTPSRN